MGCSRWTVAAVLLLLAVPSLLAQGSEVSDDEQGQPSVATEEQVANGGSSMHEDEGSREQEAPAASEQEPADETWTKAESMHEARPYGCGDTWETCDATPIYDVDDVNDDK
ncbi:hypothetical protein HPB50_009855 [Hyalomma asiaticum]|uniref:Uncharacterized protein n=1 Tax=Hyalomma asiaticum TaxID=266040 RepID=A0ACB7THS7_HYAAI|nr:hypothetical protein HPB50_009855 [Hyalomma asiaticum]